MIDTVKLWLPFHTTDYLTRDLESCFADEAIHEKKDGGIYKTARLRNLIITVGETGLSIKGSLSKYHFQDEFKELSRREIKYAIDQLSDDFRVDVNKAKVQRVDFAKTFKMDLNPKVYFTYLGPCSGYIRLEQPNSLNYRNSMRQLILYNKKAEAAKKGLKMPLDWKLGEYLRYELRYINRIAKQFNQPNILASTLSDEAFYQQAVDNYKSEFNKIQKLPKVPMCFDNIRSPKDFINALIKYAIAEIGQKNIDGLIDELKARKCFRNPEYFSRLKGYFSSFNKQEILKHGNHLIQELECHINATEQK